MTLLVKMDESDFQDYITDKEKRYAETLSSHTYEIAEDPKIRAKNLVDGYLANGFKTSYHEFYKIVHEKEICGYVWLKIEDEKRSAFLYEIYLFDCYRAKGIGTQVMSEIEEILQERDILYFKLHVFGTNQKAMRLYEALDFKIAGINMYKRLHE